MVNSQGLLEHRVLKRNPNRNAKRLKIKSSIKWLSQTFQFLFFALQNAKICVSKISAHKIIIFEVSQNRDVYNVQTTQLTGGLCFKLCTIEICTNNRCTKFQANIFIFGCAVAKRPGKGGDVTL